MAPRVSTHKAESSYQQKNTSRSSSSLGSAGDGTGRGNTQRRDIFANKPRGARQGRREICNLGASRHPTGRDATLA
ncbi:hypothetical protein B5X24_HaOG204207 [Helicoverpa armigera]|nr:hypothetical protein B5X24_HaOG204207 [Helicoverpa armigera]